MNCCPVHGGWISLSAKSWADRDLDISCGHLKRNRLRQAAGTVGRPVFHAEVGIINRDGRPARPGEVGEIVSAGPS